MIIDRTRVEKAFYEYVSEFDESDSMIRLKKLHTLKVAAICDDIARSLSLSYDDINMSWLVGMFHDIARFRQFTEYHTFFDSKSIDHAKVGCEILFDEGLIWRFIDEDSATPEELSIIRNAVGWHSAYRLPDDLSDKERLYCDLIRDADKLDIFRVSMEEPFDTVYNTSREELINSEISPDILNAFYEHHAIKRGLRQTVLDIRVAFCALAFELVYDRSKEIALEQGYVLRIMDEDYTHESVRQQAEAITREVEEYLTPYAET